jgi:hypothetical protein
MTRQTLTSGSDGANYEGDSRGAVRGQSPERGYLRFLAWSQQQLPPTVPLRRLNRTPILTTNLLGPEVIPMRQVADGTPLRSTHRREPRPVGTSPAGDAD